MFWEEINRNKRNSIILMLLFALFVIGVIVLVGDYISYIYGNIVGSSFIFISSFFAVFYTLTSYYKGDKIVLKSVGAIPLESSKLEEDKKVFIKNKVEELAIAGGIPAPKIYIMNSKMINAFATGRDPKHASICLTTGSIKKLNREELEGVIGHELGHIINYDMRYMTIASLLLAILITLTNLAIRVSWFSDRNEEGNIIIIVGILIAILAPLFGKLIQLAISRRREFLADATSVKLTRYPQGLISALEKIKKENKMLEGSSLVSPLWIWEPRSLFSTHPPIDERIKRLKKMI